MFAKLTSAIYFAGNNNSGFGGHESLPKTTFDTNYNLPTLQGDRTGTKKQINFPHLEKCEIGNGKGLDRSSNCCSNCNGNGRIQKSRKLNVTIPAGFGNGTRLRVAGEGDAGIRDASPGDLYIYLDVEGE